MKQLFAVIAALFMLTIFPSSTDAVECGIFKTDRRIRVNGKLGFRLHFNCRLGLNESPDKKLQMRVSFKFSDTVLFFSSPVMKPADARLPADRKKLAICNGGNDPLAGLIDTKKCFLEGSVFIPFRHNGRKLSLRLYDKFYEPNNRVVSLSIHDPGKRPRVVKTEEKSNNQTSRNSSETKNERKVILGPGGKRTVITTKSTTTRKETVRTRTRKTTKRTNSN